MAKVLPETVEPNGGNYTRLNFKLRNSEHKSLRKTGCYNAAVLLIHFHNKGSGDYAVLRKLVKLSEGGLGKFVATLKRRGLIERTAYQTFRPTASARALMQKALGK